MHLVYCSNHLLYQLFWSKSAGVNVMFVVARVINLHTFCLWYCNTVLHSLNVLWPTFSALFDYRIVQVFETIVDILISQENFTKVLVIEEDMALIAEQVSAWENQLEILSQTFDSSTSHNNLDPKKWVSGTDCFCYKRSGIMLYKAT